MGSRGTSGQRNSSSEEQMSRELNAELDRVDSVLSKFMSSKNGTQLDEMPEGKGLDLTHIEKASVKELIDTYIKPLNEDLRDTGNLFSFYDDDQTISILRKDGSVDFISYGDWNENKRIPTSGIDSIIVDGSWGTAVAGKNIRLYNYRRETPIGVYGYRNLEAKYNDFNDIRAEFK